MKVYFEDPKVELMSQVIEFKRQYKYENLIDPNTTELTEEEYDILQTEMVDGYLMDMHVIVNL